MSQIIANAELAKQLAAAMGRVAIVDEQGVPLAVCIPVRPTESTPFTAEYIEERRKALEPIRERIRKNPDSGKSLSEIIANLERRVGEGS